ncbi:MAG: NADP-dependent malic enzyme [Kiritimatiellae bacterium]|jgi:malate dehydrogenase (oxaloacetate-decarboxylating)|nr:NADP-dependent malic enzyme [Kiritimatiellia bacterium]MDD4342309.1 NADP-dependent malic enzyme [Kiritimatiellia bacterium]MDY0148933.1 NADP-dependent malic enzyme [Kiritimatiellia bacterium]
MDRRLEDIEAHFPASWDGGRVAHAKTIFFKALALEAHRFYGGKIQVLPRAALPGFQWFNAWYTPGVSAVSTGIRDNPDESFDLSWRGNVVAVVSDSTRVLGDGDVSPSGGLGVMEGKAFLMKVLGGVDAVPICMDSRNAAGQNDPDILIDFVRRLSPSFGAINLEDISQPNCFRVLDELRESCDIPVWHDDAQGTGCVTLAGLINALKVVGKKLDRCRIVFLGAGASNTTIARLVVQAGADPARVAMFDSKGGLHAGRSDIEADARFYRKWELCQATNPDRIQGVAEALKGADVLISLSRPGPDVIRPEWVRSMAAKAIVFACANPVPEIYPHAAKEAGALIVATGRGDFPNQVNNSLGFPGILKGALLVRARKITDAMAIAAARTMAGFAERQGLTPERIMPRMTDSAVFAEIAAAVARQAQAEGIARRDWSPEQVHDRARQEIDTANQALEILMTSGVIPPPSDALIQRCLDAAIVGA